MTGQIIQPDWCQQGAREIKTQPVVVWEGFGWFHQRQREYRKIMNTFIWVLYVYDIKRPSAFKKSRFRQRLYLRTNCAIFHYKSPQMLLWITAFFPLATKDLVGGSIPRFFVLQWWKENMVDSQPGVQQHRCPQVFVMWSCVTFSDTVSRH